MVAYNFQARFGVAVASGEKRQTIRKSGKRKLPRPGDLLQLYTGMRTKECRLLKVARCTSVRTIEIRPDFGEVILQSRDGFSVVLDSDFALEGLAALDGFSSIESFFDFFARQAGPERIFVGHLIEWIPEVTADA